MQNFEKTGQVNDLFVGRDKELKWLRDVVTLRDGLFTPIIVTGPGGVGKTALLNQLFATMRTTHTPIWLDLTSFEKPVEAVDSFVERMLAGRERQDDDIIVILDGAERMTDEEVGEGVGRIFNWKIVRGIVVLSRRSIALKRSETLELQSLDLDSARKLLQSTIDFNISHDGIESLLSAAKGFPLALQLLARLIRSNSSDDVSRLLAGNFYNLNDITVAPSSEILLVAKPKLITASKSLVMNLKKQPQDVTRLSSRDFERLLAELLTDMGWEVELTKSTRDGGKDILAYMNTELGRLLCLVEAKRYRKDRKIGIDLVRSLYGTLCDYQANSAMMVTTSSFTRDAKVFQQRHEYQLSLRDYADVVRWITQYGTK
jgi:restriction system protein